jgi:NADPH:quinone reductase-like Zn-dependent oxidoreductase
MYEKTGGPEVLQLKTVDAPQPGSGEVLIKVEAIGINRLDIIMRKGEFPLPHVPPLPRSIGMEFAGAVVDAGSGVDREKLLGKKFAGAARWCGECNACLQGNDTQCANRRLLGVQLQGAYAEYITIPVSCGYPIPTGLSSTQAVGLRTAFGTAWHMLFVRGNVRNGDTLLVESASSSIGTACIILGKMAGARVVAVTSTPEKVSKVEKLGADATLSYLSDDWRSLAKKAIGGKAFDWVTSVTGGDLFMQGLELLRFGGSILFPGAHVGVAVTVPLAKLFAFERSLVGVNGPNAIDIRKVFELAVEGKIQPIIDRAFPFEEAPEAHRYVDTAGRCGKVILQIER